MEDPRLEWLSIQEAMLREYLHTAQEALEVSKLFKKPFRIIIVLNLTVIPTEIV